MLQTGIQRQRQTLHLINYKKENIKMKKYINISYLLASLFVLLTACSEEIFSPNTLGDNVTLSLSYSDVSPKEITVNTRATDAEERRLNNLYIYIFDASGKLKGFKSIEDEANLDQNTSNSKKAEINGIKTRAGESYIYAVANINTGLYPVATSAGIIERGKLPIGLDEEKAQAGGYDFTLDNLKSLTFYRNDPKIIHISSAFLMSGAVKNGNLVNITEDGKIADDDNAIKLSRIVSKIKFTIKAATGDSRKFKLSNYTIMEISRVGSLIGTKDGNSKVSSSNSEDYSNITASIGVNDVEDGAEYFEVYLPENLQNAKNEVSLWHEREADGQSNPKTFTNAPDYGTYVVLKGKYEETKNGITRNADVTYYVHLGDCSEHINDYNVERNCKYTFNILVTGVDNIVVEACKESNNQPGAEGVVLEYGTAGKNMILDSHYEYMVMRFYQREIQDLKANGHGYYYQIKDIDGKTDPMDVKGDETIGKTNGANTDWVEFALGGTYGDANNGRGVACAYPGWQNGKRNKSLYGIEDFLKMLYNNADEDSFWGKEGYIDATCFISENYYANKTWNQYVNKVPMRTVYVANEVYESKDKRSIYAKAAYGIQQHNIQTFYDREQSGSIVAYGCETINDEDGLKYTVNGNGWTFESNGVDHWDGRSNMIQDVSVGGKWNSLKLGSDRSLIKACMSRNRDLNGDGIIDKEEVRWYAPAIDQYAGLWIGEQILNTEARLYNQSTSSLKSGDEKTGRMLYYTSTSGINTFFSEEGMATNDYSYQGKNQYPPAYVRCVRNLKSNDIGYAETPDKYYTYDTTSRLMKLDKVDSDALDPSGEQGELNEHNERSDGNKPAKAFYVANGTYNANGTVTQQKVVEGTAKCYGNYDEGGKTWRVPNQREMSLMYLVGSDLINGTFCRTKFSNMSFRKSWTFDGGNYTMNDHWGSKGSIRCIKVVK